MKHTVPCKDCPWRRNAVKGWLGKLSPADWLMAVHGEARIDCHVHAKEQCAGAAIYRGNVYKNPRDTSLLVLEPDIKTVFATPQEFLDYHTSGPLGAVHRKRESAKKLRNKLGVVVVLLTAFLSGCAAPRVQDEVPWVQESAWDSHRWDLIYRDPTATWRTWWVSLKADNKKQALTAARKYLRDNSLDSWETRVYQ